MAICVSTKHRTATRLLRPAFQAGLAMTAHETRSMRFVPLKTRHSSHSTGPGLPLTGDRVPVNCYEKSREACTCQTVRKGKKNRKRCPKGVALNEDGYYAKCSMVEMTPFDLAILFGKVRPVSDANGQGSLVEMYDRQVYLSHLQARALYDALGRSLGSFSGSAQAWQVKE